MVRISHIRTKYGEIRNISPYLVRMQEKRTRITPNADTFHAVYIWSGFLKGRVIAIHGHVQLINHIQGNA